MNKADIVEKMAADAGITKTDAQTCLESFIANVTKALKKKDGKVAVAVLRPLPFFCDHRPTVL